MSGHIKAIRRTPASGYALPELLVVLAVVSICLLAGSVSLTQGIRNGEARGAAQSWQAAAGWAQVGVLWHEGSAQLGYAREALTVSHDLGLCGGDLGSSAPAMPASTNVARWRDGDGVAVTFGGSLASPDGGGSLYFDALTGSYRVIVRPESGLTVRTRVETRP
jgi:prepilin-type N-terminal cleavage/methylation domain-containing protein